MNGGQNISNEDHLASRVAASGFKGHGFDSSHIRHFVFVIIVASVASTAVSCSVKNWIYAPLTF